MGTTQLVDPSLVRGQMFQVIRTPSIPSGSIEAGDEVLMLRDS